MGKRPRDRAAGVFHVYTHCVWAAAELFRDDLDRLSFLRHLARATDAVGWTCLSYCLMGSHYHLILEVGDDVLPRGMHRLNLGYARDFNRRHGLRGHLQFESYGSYRIESDGTLLDRVAYVALNPVAARQCDRPEDWPWSSYAETVGVRPAGTLVDDGRILALFAGESDPRAALRAYVRARIDVAAA